MDPTNCSEGLASDRLFLSPTEDAPCQVKVQTFIIVYACLIVMRGLICIQQWWFWFTKNRKSESDRNANKRRRGYCISKQQLPFVPFTATLGLLFLIIITVLAVENKVTVVNGSSLPIIFFIFLPMMILTTFYCQRLVRLGRKM